MIKKSTFLILTAALVLGFAYLGFGFAYAQGTYNSAPGTYNSADGGRLFNYFGSGSTLDTVLGKIIDYFIGVSVSVAVIIVIYGAWKMMTASGDPVKFQKGQKTVLYAAIGLLVILLARGIIGALYGIIQTLPLSK